MKIDYVYKKLKKQDDLVNKNVVGKFDVNKYINNIRTTTKDVVLMPDRLEHIKKHPEVLKYLNKIPQILSKPDYVYKQLDKENTLWIVKNIGDNIKITLKLNIINPKGKKYKNSIIQMQVLNQNRINKYEKKGKIEKIFDINDKK